LRRTETVTLKKDRQEDFQSNLRNELEQTAALRADRRNQDALRAEFLQALIEKDESATTGPVRPGRTPLLTPVRIAMLLVALVAGGSAAFIALYAEQPSEPPVAVAEPAPEPVQAPAPVQVVAEPRAKILVAKEVIPAGKRLTADMFEWADWPESAVRPEFMTETAAPDAPTSLGDRAARWEILPGEPIRTDKLKDAGNGLMSSQIAPGMRGVSATITAESASGGFVQPNDRVDVILTRGQGELQTSEIILRDVRVIAIDTNTIEGAGGKDEAGTPEPEVGKDTPAAFVNIALATFELDPARAEVLINATMVGKLSVVLRAAGETPVAAAEGESAANQAIRLSSPFWRN